jgi:YD repeat-containing protein
MCPACRVPYGPGEAACRFCGGRVATRVSEPASSVAHRIIGIVFLIPVLVGAGIWAYSNSRLTQSTAYQDSLHIAFTSPEVQNALGSAIHTKYPAFGHLSSFQHSEFAEWSVAVQGSHGHGYVYGVANQINGVWDFSRLAFRSSDGSLRVDLTPARQIKVPPVPAQRVYLVPVGLDQSQSLDWAPMYYKSKLGIDVTLLPAVPVDPAIVDHARDQVDAEKAVEFLEQKYQDLVRDPSTIMVTVTSEDIYIPSLGWSYAENLRRQGRFAVVSSARLHPPALLERINPEWLTSRLQKLITKNIALLYFSLPLNSDYTSLLSGGVLSGTEIDRMGGQIIGSERRWDPFFETGSPGVTIYEVPGKTSMWRREYTGSALPDTSAQVFSASLGGGLLVQRKMDFFSEEPALRFSRVYRNQDDRSRAFGIGGSDSFDMFLGGQMGVAVDLIMEDGYRVHFIHQPTQPGQQGEIYSQEKRGADPRFVNAVFSGDTWQVQTADGWTYFFPYRPHALPQYVTVLTGFVDPKQQRYEMERDSFGALLKVSSPTGQWLHFENDAEHRIHRIASSSGRSVTYDYDDGGHLIHTRDSDGNADAYTFDDLGQMLTAAHGDQKPFLTNEYFSDGYIKSQTMADGQKFSYAYFRDERNVIHENQITDPNGLETYVQYQGRGYFEGLPTRVPH